MREESHILEETIKEVLHALFEDEEKQGYWSPWDLAQRVGVKPEDLLEALVNPPLKEYIHFLMMASLWAALPAIFRALLDGAIEGSLPHVRFLLDVAGIGSGALSGVCALGEEDEFEHLSDDELTDYIGRAVAFAGESRPRACLT